MILKFVHPCFPLYLLCHLCLLLTFEALILMFYLKGDRYDGLNIDTIRGTAPLRGLSIACLDF